MYGSSRHERHPPANSLVEAVTVSEPKLGIDQPGGRLSVHLAAVPQLHHENSQGPILNITNHPKIADPIAPQASE